MLAGSAVIRIVGWAGAVPDVTVTVAVAVAEPPFAFSGVAVAV
jgi:hypothetical protein